MGKWLDLEVTGEAQGAINKQVAEASTLQGAMVLMKPGEQFIWYMRVNNKDFGFFVTCDKKGEHFVSPVDVNYHKDEIAKLKHEDLPARPAVPLLNGKPARITYKPAHVMYKSEDEDKELEFVKAEIPVPSLAELEEQLQIAKLELELAALRA
jgi:hypothetical protein